MDSEQVLLVAAEHMSKVRENWGTDARVEAAIVVYHMVGEDGMSVLESIESSGMTRWQTAAMLEETARRLKLEGDKERGLS